MPTVSILWYQRNVPQKSRVTRFAMGEGTTVLGARVVNLKHTSRPTRMAFGGPLEMDGGRHG